MQDIVLDLSYTYIAVTPVDFVGGFRPNIYVSFPSKKVVNTTISVGASKESSLCASNE